LVCCQILQETVLDNKLISKTNKKKAQNIFKVIERTQNLEANQFFCLIPKHLNIPNFIRMILPV